MQTTPAAATQDGRHASSSDHARSGKGMLCTATAVVTAFGAVELALVATPRQFADTILTPHAAAAAIAGVAVILGWIAVWTTRKTRRPGTARAKSKQTASWASDFTAQDGTDRTQPDPRDLLPEVPGYQRLANVRTSRQSQVEHVYVGSNGVWLVSVESHRGRLRVNENCTDIRLGRSPVRSVSQQNQEARRLAQHIERELGMSAPVHTVVVCTRSRVPATKVGTVTVVSVRELPGLLARSNFMMPPSHADAILRFLTTGAGSSNAAGHSDPGSALAS